MKNSPWHFDPDSFSVAQLANCLHISRTSAYALVGSLLSTKSVERFCENGRRVRFRLTPQAPTWNREWFKEMRKRS